MLLPFYYYMMSWWKANTVITETLKEDFLNVY